MEFYNNAVYGWNVIREILKEHYNVNQCTIINAHFVGYANVVEFGKFAEHRNANINNNDVGGTSVKCISVPGNQPISNILVLIKGSSVKNVFMARSGHMAFIEGYINYDPDVLISPEYITSVMDLITPFINTTTHYEVRRVGYVHPNSNLPYLIDSSRIDSKHLIRTGEDTPVKNESTKSINKKEEIGRLLELLLDGDNTDTQTNGISEERFGRLETQINNLINSDISNKVNTLMENQRRENERYNKLLTEFNKLNELLTRILEGEA